MNRLQELSRRLTREEKRARVTQDKNDQTTRIGRNPMDAITSESPPRNRRGR